MAISTGAQKYELGAFWQMGPSLAWSSREYIERVYGAARKLAAVEFGRNVSCFPAACPYRTEQFRTQDFWPHA